MRLALDHDDVKSGFAVGKAAALADWAFRKERREGDRLVAAVRALKWQVLRVDLDSTNEDYAGVKLDVLLRCC